MSLPLRGADCSERHTRATICNDAGPGYIMGVVVYYVLTFVVFLRLVYSSALAVGTTKFVGPSVWSGLVFDFFVSVFSEIALDILWA